MGDAKEVTTALFKEERELGPAACCRDLGAGISSTGREGNTHRRHPGEPHVWVVPASGSLQWAPKA
jgi:hypothetical protein